MKRYEANWSKMLVGISSRLTVVCLGIGLVTVQTGAGVAVWFGWLPVALTAGCALFAVRGYSVTPDAILIHRLFWVTELPRVGLESAESVPHAMRWSIRTFGNGGSFSFSGYYWDKALGSYRAYVTDPARTVVLRYRSKRTVLVSPVEPERFTRELSHQ